MANLLERTDSLNVRIQAYKSLRDQAQSARELQARAKDISSLHKELAALQECRRLFRVHGVALGKHLKPSTTLKNKADSLLEMFIADEFSLTRETTQFGATFNRPLGEFNSRLQGALLEGWRTYVDEKLPKIGERMLETFAGMGFADEVAKIRALLAKARTLRDALPRNGETFKELSEIITQLNAVWRNLDEIPADVQAFFRRAANNEALLDELTDPIRQWMDNHGFLGMLRLGLAK